VRFDLLRAAFKAALKSRVSVAVSVLGIVLRPIINNNDG